MKFFSHHKVSFVDYPGKISTLLFVSGCNLNCKYCYNAILKRRKPHIIDETEIFNFLRKRKAFIEAVCISGGEPSLYENDLEEFFIKLKSEHPDILIKVDTNGTSPGFIKKILNYVDFISMDFKTLNYRKYLKFDDAIIDDSLTILKESAKDYEVRITVYPEYIGTDEFSKIANKLDGIKSVTIQQYEPVNNVSPYPPAILQNFAKILSKKVKMVFIKNL